MSELLEIIENETKLKKEHLNKEVQCLDNGFVRLVDFMGTDSSIVQAARVSYGKGTKNVSSDRGLIRYLMRKKHTSPFEQVEFKFHIKLPIVSARQMIRHRTANVNEISFRYSEAQNECYVPELSRLQKQATDNKQGSDNDIIENAEWTKYNMEREQEYIFENYETYLKAGLAREISRLNLPVSTYTQWYWKMDLHNLFHFLKLRNSSHAQYEIRVYAEAIYELIKPIVPISCEAFEDYILNAVTFSAQEMEIIRKLMPTAEVDLPKREKIEFYEKMGWE